MTCRRSGIAAILALVLAAPAALFAQPPSQKEIDSLKQAVEAQEQSIRDLKARIRELEEAARVPAAAVPSPAAPAAAPAVPVAPAVDVASTAARSPAEDAEAEMANTTRQSHVSDRGQFDDKQDAASRPGDFTLDPQYRGFIPIPHTVFMLKFNPKPRLDMMLDTENAGDDFRFVTAKIPVEGQSGYGGGENFNANGNGSQLRLDMQAPSVGGNFRFYYQNDFFGSDSKNFQYRLQHLYGRYYGLLVGYTYGVFEDPDAWPDTVDYEGPNAVVYSRRPLVHYTVALADDWNATVGVEDPDIYVNTDGNPDASKRTRAPDTGFNVRWEPADLGHIQFSTLFRSLGIKGKGVKNQDVFGWGVNLAGSLNVTASDTIQFWGVYGQGVGGQGNDTSFVDSDAALDSSGDLIPLEYVSGLLAFSHNWAPRWRSTVTYGYVNLQNTFGEADDAYADTHYASANVVFKVFKRLSVGFETLYGYRNTKSGADGDVVRFQLGMLYSIFD